MSIVIKGISMPDKCSKCPFCGLAGRYMDRLSCMFTGKSEFRDLLEGRLPDCPVAQLPEGFENEIFGGVSDVESSSKERRWQSGLDGQTV